MFYLLNQVEIKKNELIYEQGKINDYVYLIDSGRLEMQKQVDSENFKQEEFEDSVNIYLKKEEKKKFIPICLLEEGSIFGDIEP